MDKKENTIEVWHKPVLVNEVLHYLDPQPGKTYLDVTFGSGGHSHAILDHEPKCNVIAMDWDALSLETYAPLLQEKFGDRLQIIWGNFAQSYRLLKKVGIEKVDGILADFGTSYMHIKERAGFSVYLDTPLDMRMSPAHQQVTAAHVIKTASQEKLQEIFWQLGEEKQAKKIARIIVQKRREKPIKTTRDLASIIERAIPRKKQQKTHPATKIFQALRIYINQELDNISGFLSASLMMLNTTGRLVCISFHSLEDRLVKQFFKEHEKEGHLKVLTKRVVVPTQKEIEKNPSARSAKLRAAMFMGD